MSRLKGPSAQERSDQLMRLLGDALVTWSEVETPWRLVFPHGKPFFFAGTWMTWEGTRGTKKAPVTGKHELFTFLTTSPNKVVKPVHAKAMPVLLLTDATLRHG